MNAPRPSLDITLVMLTYGSRLPFLQRSLARAREEGVRKCVLVDNGSSARIEETLAPIYGDWLTTVRMGRNAGSAVGNAVGIRKALDDGGAYVLLLDDDNVLEPGSLEKLAEAMRRAEVDAHGGPTAVIGFRRHLIQPTLDLVRQHRLRPSGIEPTPAIFLGFDLISAIRRRLAGRFVPPATHAEAAPEDRAPDRPAQIPFGPYGGCLFNRAAIERIGVPDPTYCLYFDDTEFTGRMSAIGHPLIVVTDALIEDLDDANAHDAVPRSVIGGMIDSRSDRTAYYLTRNRVFWERHVRHHGGCRYALNAAILITLVSLSAIAQARVRSLRVVGRAIFDGWAKRMGESPQFRLP